MTRQGRMRSCLLQVSLRSKRSPVYGLFEDSVYFVQFHESLWAKDALEPRPTGSPPSKISVTVSHASLNRELVGQIGMLFAEAIGRAAKSDHGVDGTTYRISANAACGQAWSPKPGSPSARL